MAILVTDHCADLAHPDPFTVLLASFLLVGIVGSYLPQHIKLIRHRTSEGLSPWWVLLGGLSSIAAIGNILTLPASRVDIGCCKSISGGACAAALLGVAQIGLQWACFMFIVMLYLIFFPAATETVDLSGSVTTLASLTASPAPRRRDAIIVGCATLLALLTTGIVSIALVAAWPHHTQRWADLLGTVAGGLACVQYVPQIIYTYRLGDVKSLSILTMLVQTPGSFLFAFSLWQRVGTEGWSTWLVYIITGALQGVLLFLAITYYMRGTETAKEADEDDHGGVDDVDGADEADENTALLRAQQGSLRPNRGAIAVSHGTHRSQASERQLSMLYAATPPEHDSDRSSIGR